MSRASVDKNAVEEAYNDVRNDNSDTEWAVFEYDENEVIGLTAKGTQYEAFQQYFRPDNRAYGYVRVQSGDELSKRAKFVLVTWVGESVSGTKRARVTTDKALVKAVIQSYAKEVTAFDPAELNYETVLDLVRKAGGANYGTGSRD